MPAYCVFTADSAAVVSAQVGVNVSAGDELTDALLALMREALQAVARAQRASAKADADLANLQNQDADASNLAPAAISAAKLAADEAAADVATLTANVALFPAAAPCVHRAPLLA